MKNRRKTLILKENLIYSQEDIKRKNDFLGGTPASLA